MARRGLAEAFGIVVRAKRVRQGISQEALAEKADIHRNYMGMLERGECAATLDIADRIARGLGVPLHGLIQEANNEYRRSPPSTKRELPRPPKPKKRRR